MAALADHKRTVAGIGVTPSGSESDAVSIFPNFTTDLIKLNSQRINFIPDILKKTLVVLEITVKMFRRAKKLNPHIIHCHDTPVLPLGLALKLFTGAKIIYDAHELESERAGVSKLACQLTLFVEKISWKYIDRLIVVSPSIQSWYIKKIGFKKSEIVLNSPIVKFEDSNKEYLRDKFSIPKDSLIFIYNGMFFHGRGIELITRVFQQSNIQSHIVFLGDGDMKGELLRVAKDHNNIHLHERVPHEDVVPITRGADVGLVLTENISLSYYFSLPNKLFEYAFSGIPVLASNTPDILETVKKYDLGECCNIDFDSLYNGVLKFENEKLIRKFNYSDLGDLSWDAQKVKLRKLYSELIVELK
jgi:glycosyltransferase involved in cell wall biosynthesis